MDDSRVIGIYLGAGKSSRMGRNKLELPFGDYCLGSIGFQAALKSRLAWTIAVTRNGDPLNWLAPFSTMRGWSCLQCNDADLGQSASLKAGLKAAISIGAEAVMILLADMPFVSAGLINHFIDEFKEAQDRIYVAASMQPPVLFAKSAFPVLLQLEGDQGARTLLQGVWKGRGKLIQFPGNEYMLDIDTVEDYQAFEGREEHGLYWQKCYSKRSL